MLITIWLVCIIVTSFFTMYSLSSKYHMIKLGGTLKIRGAS